MSKPSKHPRTKATEHVAPPTVSAPSLLRRGSDRAFQKLIVDLFTISARTEDVRSHLASSIGVSPPQYSLLRAVAVLQGRNGVSIGTVADHLHVTNAFITAQSRGLVERGLVDKQEDEADRRVSLLSLTTDGERLVDEIIKQVRPINDMFFGVLDRHEFDALTAIMEKLVQSSRTALIRLASERQAASQS
jgi:DNA-binding MarR family transcriptional regulator